MSLAKVIRDYFGSYYEHFYKLKDGKKSSTTLQTPLQLSIKRSMGLV